MATIYHGWDTYLEQVVAVKVLREVYSADPKFLARFQREAEVMYSLQHPNIVHVYDYGHTNGDYFIIMELVDGIDLSRFLRSRGILDANRNIMIARDVAIGLNEAHYRGIVHRAVIPQHILMDNAGPIKLSSFTIASVKGMGREELSTTGASLNIVPYYAPEQAMGEIVTPATDIYALGIVMYEMLTCHPPFDGNSPVVVAMQHIKDVPKPPSQFNPNIPGALEEIIMRCLEKVPDMRFRDGSELAKALEALI
jgi:serine/threonine protein kinase